MFSDSRLVVRQVKGELEARDMRMQEYLSQVKRLQPSFDLFSLSHISRSGNTHADSLATVRAYEVKIGPSWMDPIVMFFKDDILPEEKSEA